MDIGAGRKTIEGGTVGNAGSFSGNRNAGIDKMKKQEQENEERISYG